MNTTANVLAGVIAVFVGLFFLIFWAFIWAFVVRWAWNTFMPYMFDLQTISYWQAYALSVLGGLFGGAKVINSKS